MKGKKYKFIVLKGYFEKGYALTNYIKYIIALFGISSLDVRLTLILGVVYGLSCFLIGWGWYVWDFQDMENDFFNKYNPFVKNVERKLSSNA